MDSIQKQLVYCLAAFRQGQSCTKNVVGTDPESWKALQQLAALHKMGPMVYETMHRCPEFCGEDASLRALWRRDTMLQTIGQTYRSAKIMELTALLEDAGIPYVLVKGLVCRALYAQPDMRPSGDEDLVIRPEDQARCGELLRQNGCRMMMDGADVTHWQEPTSGLHIELHTSLSEDPRLDAQFMAQIPQAVPAELNGGTVQTLPPTWHFIFLICHAMKHFLTGGVGVRTICDVVSFAEQYREEIDIPTVEKLMQQMHGRVFLDQILAIGQEWWGFDPQAAGWRYVSVPDPDELLLDCLEAGVYGQSSLSRKHSAEMVMQAVETRSGKVKLRSTVFPNKEKMLRRYPILDRCPVLLPACWVHRLGLYAAEVLHSKNGDSPLKSMALGKQRAAMMAKYGIVPKEKKR